MAGGGGGRGPFAWPICKTGKRAANRSTDKQLRRHRRRRRPHRLLLLLLFLFCRTSPGLESLSLSLVYCWVKINKFQRMPGLGAPTNLQEERYPRPVCMCVWIRVCMSQHKQFVANFRTAGFCCALAPARCSQARSVALSPSAELLSPDALRMSSNNGPGQQHRPVAVGVSLEVKTGAVCSPHSLPQFLLLIFRLFFFFFVC